MTLFVSTTVFAQRLYVHDIQNGNYQSYEKNSRIVLYMLDSSAVTRGTITNVYNNAISLSGDRHIEISQIASILPPDKAKPVKRFLGVVGGILLVTTGTIYFIAGAATLKDDPAVGAVAMVMSAGLFTGGVFLLKHSKKAKQQVKQQVIDNVNYRIFIE